MIRAVVDINTFVSGIFWKGTPRAVYLAAVIDYLFQSCQKSC